jgi:hypothetical protein
MWAATLSRRRMSTTSSRCVSVPPRLTRTLTGTASAYLCTKVVSASATSPAANCASVAAWAASMSLQGCGG